MQQTKECNGCLLKIEEAKKDNVTLRMNPLHREDSLMMYAKREKPDKTFFLCCICVQDENLKKRL